jgi:methyl-accepting chemotaxis protein
MISVAPPFSDRPGPHKRSLRNYLIDPSFQLKYTALLMVLVLAVGGVLGVVVWRTSRDVVAQSQEILRESRKVSDLARLYVRDFADDAPELAAQFNAAASQHERTVEARQLELLRQQNRILYALVGGVSLLVVLVGLFGIFVTHKVAGPIYKIKRLLRQLGDGKLVYEGRLRRGDELQDFWAVFAEAVDKLRARRLRDIEQLGIAIGLAQAGEAKPESIARIVAVREAMKRSLDS